jgi:hypothetical protein
MEVWIRSSGVSAAVVAIGAGVGPAGVGPAGVGPAVTPFVGTGAGVGILRIVLVMPCHLVVGAQPLEQERELGQVEQDVFVE